MNNLDGIMAVKLSCTKLGTSRSLNAQDREVVGEAFDGTRDGFRGSAVLLTSKQVKPITSHLTALRKFWVDFTQPYHEDGVRLANITTIDKFNDALAKAKANMRLAEQTLEQHRTELLDDAQKRLGNKFSAGDYPPSFVGCWDAKFSYPTLMPDERLKTLHPALYEAEKQKILAQVQEAAQKTIAMLASQLAELAEHMIDVVTPDPETGAMKKLTRFDALDHLLERFTVLCASITSPDKDKLEDALRMAREVMEGRETAKVRSNPTAQQEIRDGFTAVKDALHGLVETMPERIIELDEPDDAVS